MVVSVVCLHGISGFVSVVACFGVWFMICFGFVGVSVWLVGFVRWLCWTTPRFGFGISWLLRWMWVVDCLVGCWLLHLWLMIVVGVGGLLRFRGLYCRLVCFVLFVRVGVLLLRF